MVTEGIQIMYEMYLYGYSNDVIFIFLFAYHHCVSWTIYVTYEKFHTVNHNTEGSVRRTLQPLQAFYLKQWITNKLKISFTYVNSQESIAPN